MNKRERANIITELTTEGLINRCETETGQEAVRSTKAETRLSREKAKEEWKNRDIRFIREKRGRGRGRGRGRTKTRISHLEEVAGKAHKKPLAEKAIQQVYGETRRPTSKSRKLQRKQRAAAKEQQVQGQVERKSLRGGGRESWRQNSNWPYGSRSRPMRLEKPAKRSDFTAKTLLNKT